MANQPKRKAQKISFPKKGKLAKKAKLNRALPKKNGVFENQSGTVRNVTVTAYYLLKIWNWFKDWFD